MEEKQRFSTKKKEAWEFFRRLPSLKPKRQEEFEEEFKRKVMTGNSSGSPEGREGCSDEWKIELQKKSAGRRASIGSQGAGEDGREEDSSSRRRKEWERIFDRSPFLKAPS